MVKGVIFDLDGTLLDSIDALWRSFNAGVSAFNLEPVGKKRLTDLMNSGSSLPDILREVYPELRKDSASGTLVGINEEIRRDYVSQDADRVKFSSGAEELFHRLRARKLKTGIVTSRSSTPERVWEELDNRRIARFFDAVVTGAEARRKPAPDSVIICLKRLGLSPGECIFIGDSQADIRAGKAAGLMTVAVATGVSIRKALEAESPDFVFNDLHGFIEKLDFILNGD
jgi:HAD superfamily hydrolase (TIGR01509 family)